MRVFQVGHSPLPEAPSVREERFTGVATMEGKNIAEALKEAIRLWLRERGIEPKEDHQE